MVLVIPDAFPLLLLPGFLMSGRAHVDLYIAHCRKSECNSISLLKVLPGVYPGAGHHPVQPVVRRNQGMALVEAAEEKIPLMAAAASSQDPGEG